MKSILNSFVFACAVMAFATPAFAQSSGYHVVKKFNLAGADRWDYVALCPVNDNVYIAHGTQVDILDRATGLAAGVIENTEGVHGIAFAPEFHKGFTSNGKSNSVTVFDLRNNHVLANITTGENPDAIMYDEYSRKVYVCDGRSKELAVIDPKKNRIVKMIELGGRPEALVSDNAGRIYVNIENKNELVVINANKYEVEKRWITGNGDGPTGIAIDTKNKRLFIGCDKLLVVMSAKSGTIVKELTIGEGCDGVAFDNTLQYIFCSNGDGTLTVVKQQSPSEYKVIDNVKTKAGARTLAVDELTHKIYLPVYYNNSFHLLVVDKSQVKV